MATGSADIAAPCQGERLTVVVVVVGGVVGWCTPRPPPTHTFIFLRLSLPVSGLSIRIHLSDGSF